MTLGVLARPSTLRSRAYQALKSSIISGELRPGSVESEAGLARQFGISRGPLREAIRQLKEEGLVADVLASGFMIAPLNERTVAEVYGVRFALESMAAKLAVDRIPVDEVEFLAREMARAERLGADEITASMNRYDFQFHDLWVKNSGNELLSRHIGRLRDHVSRIVNHIKLPESHFIASFEEHKQILSAFRANDPVLFRTLVENHIVAVCDRLLAALRT